MKIDLYTKVVLTIIALALSVIACRNVDFVTPANAQGGSSPSYSGEVIDVNIRGINLDYSYNYLPVEVMNTVDVKNSN